MILNTFALRWRKPAVHGRWGGAVQKIRSVFKYAYEAGLIDHPARYGLNFKRPGKSALRRERNEKQPRLFTAATLRTIIVAAIMPLKAMVLLGINCGLIPAIMSRISRWK